MRKFLIFSLLILAVGGMNPLFAQGKPDELAQFKKVLTQVQEGVAQNNPEKVAAVANFPKFYWEDQGFADDLTKDVFMKNYAKFFTPMIKAKLAEAKYHRTVNGDYSIEWRVKASEYDLVFEKQPDGSYKFAGLATGPAD
jgi:hypothetical protein